MEILEKHIEGKKINIYECEDELVVTDDFIAVIDGVTSKSAIKLNNSTTGRFAAETIADVIKKFKKDISIEEAVTDMTEAIEDVYISNSLLDTARNNVTDRLAASVIIYSRFCNEVWSIGDCQCMVDGEVHTFPKVIDDIISDARALYIETELLNGKTVEELLQKDTSREYVLPLIKAAAGFENSSISSEYAFGVIDGFKTNEKSVHVIKTENCRTVILASDGYPKLFDTLEKSEDYLNHIIENDPLCFREYKCTKGLVKGNKSFDDRTYIRFRI